VPVAWTEAKRSRNLTTFSPLIVLIADGCDALNESLSNTSTILVLAQPKVAKDSA
jgi:hypothetical protein